MKDLVLIDGDIVAFRCAATAQGLSKEIAIQRVEEMMQRIVHDTNASNQITWLTGSNNFRKEIYPEYKANRKGKPSPEFLNDCREYLVTTWKAKVTDGNEADDELGIEQVAQGENSVIATIDKDLLQIPGYHYNFVTGVRQFVSPFDALRSFYKQVITGDAADNVPAFDGKLRNTVPQFVQRLLDPIDSMTNELDMYTYSKDIWINYDEQSMHQELNLHRNAQVLYIQKKVGDRWVVPNGEQENTNPD